LTTVEVSKNKPETITAFKKELNYVRGYVGEDYLEKLRERLDSVESEIIITIENRKQ
jgi:mannitol/fructose-specific phosphotransferase system IIA component